MTGARPGAGEVLSFVSHVDSKSTTTTTYLFRIQKSPQRHSHGTAGPAVSFSRQHGGREAVLGPCAGVTCASTVTRAFT